MLQNVLYKLVEIYSKSLLQAISSNILIKKFLLN